MSLSLEAVKHINAHVKDLVSGYIRNIQASFPYEQNAFYLIPQLMETIILIFYYGEYFAVCGYNIKMKNATIISYSNPGRATAYGHIDIVHDTKKKYIWKFKLLKFNPYTAVGSCIWIGIDSWANTAEHYGLLVSNGIDGFGVFVQCVPHKATTSNEENSDPKYYLYQHGLEIRMELDTKNKTLIYYISGKKFEIWINDIKFVSDTIYGMNVTFESGEYELSLIEFQITESK